jgi:Protein of unknown function (DUF2934)
MAKSKKANGGTGTAADRAPTSSVLSATVTDSDVARRAYDLYLARGREHGHDVDDWLQAERELQRPSTPTPHHAAI